MNKSNQYNLNFGVRVRHDGFRKPVIGTPIINGESINHEIASFLEPNGIINIESIRFDVKAFLFSNEPIDDINIWGHHDAECIQFRHHPPNPPVIIFNTGGREVEVPVSDFLQILDEWEAFVKSVPKPHWLENR